MSASKAIVIAVYGSLKRDFYNHRVLEGASFLASGTVTGFEMFSLGSYPMVVPGDGSIAVELYEVNTSTFGRLDRLEGFPRFYGRQMVTVATDYCPVEAWMYVGQVHQVKGQRRVDSGMWAATEEEPQRLRR